jgi:hypothetical protein
MPETARIWTETIFNIVYLIVVWWLVIMMYLRRALVPEADRRTAGLIMWAYFLLGLGDIGHVGFRVVAYARDGLGTTVQLLGKQVLLAPMGSLATAVTFTFFYMVMIMIWRARFEKSYGLFGWFLFALGVARLLLMTHPANNWNSLEPPLDWAIYRNLFLMLMQLGVAYLVLRDAVVNNDSAFLWIGIMILVSFVCYAPVVFLQYRVPLIGMLMIPKTIAYLVIAFIGYRKFYGAKPLQEFAPQQAI